MKISKKWLQKVLSGALAISMVTGMATTSFAADKTEYAKLADVVKALEGQLTWNQKENKIVFNLSNGMYTYDYKTGLITLNSISFPKTNGIEVKNGTTYVSQTFIDEVINVDGNIVNGKADVKPFAQNLESTGLSQVEKDLQNKIKTYLTFENLYGQFDGQVLISKGDKILVHQAYGDGNILTKDDASILDTYGIGSVTKQLTAYAVLTLEKEGKLNVQDKLSVYLPDAPYADQVTLDQLLTHTSGMAEYAEGLLTGEPMNSTEDVINWVKAKPLKFEPGTDWSYCNTGYYLLGEIVEKLSGMSLEAYFDQLIFTPLKMDQTGWGVSEGKLATTTLGSSSGDVENTVPLDVVLLKMAKGAGSIKSTADDMYLWQKALYGGDLLSEETLLKMEGLDGQNRVNPNYGYGLMNMKNEFGLEVGHGGNTIGFTTSVSYHEASDMHIIILSNKGQFNLSKIKTNILNLEKGNPVPLNIVEKVKLPEASLKALEGQYDITGILKINIFVKDGMLMLQGEGQPAIAMDAIGSNTFINETVGIKIVFDRAENPTKFVLHQAGLEMDAVKVK